MPIVSLPIAAYFYDGKSSQRHAAQLSASDTHLVLNGNWGQRQFALADVEVAEPLGRAPRMLRFADGAYCEISDHAAFATLLQVAGHREGFSVWLHQRWSFVLASLLALSVGIVAAYLWGLPAAAAVIAPRIPPAVTEHLSAASLSTLDQHFLRPSAAPPAREVALRKQMAIFATQAGAPAYQLHFRAPPKGMPPNAFALPNGDIVIFDNLLGLLSNDEIIAVFAHELGHVAHHHGLRNMLQSAVVSTVAAVYLGDLSSAAAALAAASLEANYSQSFENEADAYGAALLKRGGQSPRLLADALAKLETATDSSPQHEESLWLRLFSSHPSTGKRIEALRGLAD